MKKFFTLLLAFVFVLNVTQAFGASVAKIEKYIDSLESKLASATTSAKKAQLRRLISEAQASLEQAKGDQSASSYSAPETTSNNELADFQEQVNVAIAGLNSKIDGVEKKTDKGATVAGRAYVSYTKDLKSGSTTPNQFSIDRVYIDFKKSLDRDVSARFTTDVGYESGLSGGKWNTYLKYAYFDLGNFSKHLPAASILGLDNVIIGQSATNWIDFMQGFWNFRYVAKTLTDHYKLYNSADLGVALKGGFDLSGLKVPYLGRIDYHAVAMNGNGYKTSETNQGKDLGLTLITNPITDLTLALGYYAEDVPLSSFSLDGLTKSYTAMGSYKFSEPGKGLVFVEYANVQDSTTGGYCLGGQYEVYNKTNLFGRYDSYKKSGSDYVNNIAGLEYNWGSNVKIALDYQHETKDKVDNSKKIALHTRVKW